MNLVKAQHLPLCEPATKCQRAGKNLRETFQPWQSILVVKVMVMPESLDRTRHWLTKPPLPRTLCVSFVSLLHIHGWHSSLQEFRFPYSSLVRSPSWIFSVSFGRTTARYPSVSGFSNMIFGLLTNSSFTSTSFPLTQLYRIYLSPLDVVTSQIGDSGRRCCAPFFPFPDTLLSSLLTLLLTWKFTFDIFLHWSNGWLGAMVITHILFECCNTHWSSKALPLMSQMEKRQYSQIYGEKPLFVIKSWNVNVVNMISN